MSEHLTREIEVKTATPASRVCVCDDNERTGIIGAHVMMLGRARGVTATFASYPESACHFAVAAHTHVDVVVEDVCSHARESCKHHPLSTQPPHRRPAIQMLARAAFVMATHSPHAARCEFERLDGVMGLSDVGVWKIIRYYSTSNTARSPRQSRIKLIMWLGACIKTRDHLPCFHAGGVSGGTPLNRSRNPFGEGDVRMYERFNKSDMLPPPKSRPQTRVWRVGVCAEAELNLLND